MILNTDEISPGAILRPIVKKKSYVWFVSILELRHLLSRTEMWVPIAVLRASILKQLPGGLAVPPGLPQASPMPPPAPRDPSQGF